MDRNYFINKNSAYTKSYNQPTIYFNIKNRNYLKLLYRATNSNKEIYLQSEWLNIIEKLIFNSSIKILIVFQIYSSDI
jgi:hypothetical protein